MSKVKVGMKFPKFAKIASEAQATLPTYGAEIVDIGEAISGNLTVNLASGELYSNDALNIKMTDFANASIALETDGLDDEVATVLFGATANEGLVTYKAGDAAPNGGLTYYTPMRDKTGAVYYKGYFFPKVQAAMGNDNAATKGSSISFQTANTTFTIMKCNSDAWMQTEVLSTEAEALAWCETKLGKTTGGE